MNKKVILIDDKVDRQKKSMTDSALEELDALEQTGSFVKKNSFDTFEELDDYNLIIVHSSYLVDTGREEEMRRYIECSTKDTVLFSGGTTLTTFPDSRVTSVSSNLVYSNKLPSFIKKYCNEEMELPLLRFVYGENWRLSLLTKYRYLIWMYGSSQGIDNDTDILVADQIECTLWPDSDIPTSIEELDRIISDEIHNLHGHE